MPTPATREQHEQLILSGLKTEQKLRTEHELTVNHSIKPDSEAAHASAAFTEMATAIAKRHGYDPEKFMQETPILEYIPEWEGLKQGTKNLLDDARETHSPEPVVRRMEQAYHHLEEIGRLHYEEIERRRQRELEKMQFESQVMH